MVEFFQFSIETLFVLEFHGFGLLRDEVCDYSVGDLVCGGGFSDSSFGLELVELSVEGDEFTVYSDEGSYALIPFFEEFGDGDAGFAYPGHEGVDEGVLVDVIFLHFDVEGFVGEYCISSLALGS